MPRYILTAASGHIGSRTLKHILEKNLIAPRDLIISSSNPANVPKIAKEYGVDVRRGDFGDPALLEASFAGGDVLFLISHPDPGVHRVELHKNAIDAARSAGVKTVIYASMMFGGETGLNSVIGIQQGHLYTIKYLTECGVDHVIVRQGIYAQGWMAYAGFQNPVFEVGRTEVFEWVIPNDGAIAWADWDELAQANALILANYKQYIGQTLRLTGPRATKISEIAKLVEAQTGRKVNLRFVGRDEAVRYHRDRMTLPARMLPFLEENWGGWYEGLANGEGEVVDPLLGKLLGRQPRGMQEMAEQLFKPGAQRPGEYYTSKL